MIEERVPLIELTADGDPPSKARARFTGYRYSGGRAYTPEKTRTAEDALGWQIKAAYPGLQPDPDHDFRVVVGFFTKTWQRRDLDNLAKLVLDACNRLVWVDDAQVTELEIRLRRGDPRPRTELTIFALEPNRRPMINCERCDKPVSRAYPSHVGPRRARYCSDECRRSVRAAARTRSCVGCGATFVPPASHTRKYCRQGCIPRPGPTIKLTDDLAIATRRTRDRERQRVRRGGPGERGLRIDVLTGWAR